MSILYMCTIYPLELIYKHIYLACVSVVGSYGVGLMVMSLVTFVIFVPLKKWAKKAAGKERDIQDVLAPQIAKIQSESTGAERQERISKLYKRYGYHPVMAIRSAIGAGLQIPFLMAAYYMISGLKGLEGQSFLFVKNLSRPDGLLFGLNLLPIVMTLINFATTFTTKDMRKKDRIQAIIIALLFLALLYSAPSALLIYWTCNNILYLAENIKPVKAFTDEIFSLVRFMFDKGIKKPIGRLSKRNGFGTAVCFFYLLKPIRTCFEKLIKPEIVLALTFCVIIPFNFYVQNNNQIPVTFSQMLPWLMLAFMSVCFCIICIETILGMINKKTLFVFRTLLSGILVCFIIQSFFVTVDYGVFNGADIDWSKFKSVAVWNTISWIVVCALIFVFLCKNNKYMTLLASYALTLVMTISAYNYVTTPIFKKKMTFFSDEHLYEVSRNKNMIVLILDTFDSEIFQELLRKYPENNKKLAGFTYYPDIVGAYPTTAGALPQIITGKYYKNEKMYDKYVEEAYKDNKFFNLIKNNYDIDIYTMGTFAATATIARNLHSATSFIKDKQTVVGDNLRISLFKGLPHILKKYVRIDDRTGMQGFARQSNPREYVSIGNNFWFMADLKKNGLTVVSSRPSFKIIHLSGAHPPYNMNKNSEKIDNQKNNIYEHSQGALNLAYQYIEYLKQAGMYNNVSIVIMGDHGLTSKFRRPLMLIKSANTKRENVLKIDDNPVSYKNLLATFADLMGLPYQDLGIPFRLESKEDKRFFYWYSWDDRWDSMAYLTIIYEYEVIGKAQDKTSWKKTGKVFSIEELDNTYQIGKMIMFSRGKNSSNYIEDGFSNPEMWGSWSEGTEAVMKMRIRKGKHKKLFLNLTAHPYLGKTLKEQVVTVFANDQEIAQWHINKKDIWQAEIPATAMPTDNLKLVFKISNPLSPASEKVSGDKRNLGIGFYDMTIDVREKIQKANRMSRDQQKDTTAGSKSAMECTVALGESISFRSADSSKCSQAKGFSANEDWGTWSDGKEVVMGMRVKKGKHKKLFLNLTAHPYLGTTLKEQVVTVLANEQEIAQWHINKKDVWQAEIPASVMATDDLKLVFKISDPVFLSGRNLGIGFINMVIEEDEK